jgi:hypothetical protein
MKYVEVIALPCEKEVSMMNTHWRQFATCIKTAATADYNFLPQVIKYDNKITRYRNIYKIQC